MKRWYKTSTVSAAIISGIMVIIATSLSVVKTFDIFSGVDKSSGLEISAPVNAIVYLDDKEVGVTPLSINVIPGSYILKISKSGFQSISESITFESNKRISTNFELAPITVTMDSSLTFENIASVIERLKILEKRIELIEHKDNEVNSNILKTVTGELDKLKESTRDIKKLIFDDPEKAISVSLIKKDIEQLKETNKLINNQIDDVFDLSKWFVGILITICLGLFGLVISIVISSKQSKESE